MFFIQDRLAHEGEKRVRQAMHAPKSDDPTFPALSPQLASHLQVAPLIAVGTLDKQGRPWTTLWGGDSGFARPLGGNMVGFRTPVPGRHDPVVEELVDTDVAGEVVREEGPGRMVSGLTIDLETRKRVKMYGRMVAGTLQSREDEVTGVTETLAEIQLVLNIEQSLGNCPKYLNSKHIVPAVSKPHVIDNSPHLSQRACDLLNKADLFFVSSAQHSEDMDTNHRGGPPGFMRVVSNDQSGAVIVWPEYSGNRLYQTLGNLAVNPMAGICVPDFETGGMLFATGRTEILIGTDAAHVLPRSNLAVQLTITDAQFVANILPFRGIEGQRSPYNPVVRYLASEKKNAALPEQGLQSATLLRQTKLTPTISRFKFALDGAASYQPGQYVTLDFARHLDLGYSHMRDDDPRSLNDDFVRTFTVSSSKRRSSSQPHPRRDVKDNEFEITIRRVGVVTDFLFGFEGSEVGGARSELDVGIKGFGGEFEVKQESEGERIDFIAAGVGITPLLPSLDGGLEYARLKVLWSVRKGDMWLVLDTLEQHPELGPRLVLFVTDAPDESINDVLRPEDYGAIVHRRRMRESDVRTLRNEQAVGKHYVCTGVPMRKQLIDWLPGKELVLEDFNF